ncbi:MAG: hypothetical protein FWE06_00160 [Oscillospiraceae bacterium]|nr:hypothetical protein [Oscillospiraceae bacterium]
MSQIQNIALQLDLPTNVISQLANISQRLNDITSSANKTTSSWERMAHRAGQFNNVYRALDKARKAINKVKDAETRAKAVKAAYNAQKIIAAAKAKLSAAAYKVETAALTLNDAAATKLKTKNNALLASQTALRYGAKKSAIALKLKAAGLKIVSVALKVASVAVKIFNKVLMMNPIFAVIAAIVALVAIVGGLISIFRRNNCESKRLQKQYEELNESIAANARANDRARQSIQQQTTTASRLTNELERLNRIENKSAADKQRTREIVDTLNSTYSDLNISVDEYGNLLGHTTDEIQKHIREAKGVEELQRIQTRRNELLDEQSSLQQALIEEQRELERLEASNNSKDSDKIDESRERIESMEQSLLDAADAYEQYAYAERYAISQSGELIEDLAKRHNTSTDEIVGAMRRYNICMDDAAAHMGMLNDRADEFGVSLDELTDTLERQGIPMQNLVNMTPELAGATVEAAVAMDQLMQAYDDAYDAALSSIESQIGLFGRLDFETEKTAGSMVNTWLGQAADFEKHTENLARAAQMGMAPEVVAAFNDVSRAGELNALLDGIENGCNSMAEMGDTAEEQMDAVNSAFASADMGAQDLASAMAKIESDFENGMIAIVTLYETQIQELDVSDRCQRYGQDSINGLINGLRSREGAAGDAINRICDSILGRLRGSLRINSPSRVMDDMGTQTMQGFINGINNKERAATSAAQRIANGVSNTISRALRINSPSRVMMSLGRHTISGFCLGIERMQRRVKSIITQTACMVQDGLNVALNSGEISGNLALVTADGDSTTQTRMMERLIGAVEAGKTIVMDSGELVGATYSHFDTAGGQAIAYNSRWGR